MTTVHSSNSCDEASLKILHLLNDVENHGNGIVNYTVDLAIQQRAEGHVVTVASAGGAWVEFLGQHGIRHIRLTQKGRNAPKALLFLCRFLRGDPQDIVHAQMVTGALLARSASVFTKTPLVTTVHNTQDRQAVLMGVGDRVIAVSEAVRLEMISRGIKSSKLCTVRNGMVGSVRHQLPAIRPPIELRHPAVLTVAGLYQRKGISDLIKAIHTLKERIPGVALYIAGDGPDRPMFEGLAKNAGLVDDVVFLGFRSDIRRLLSQADVFALASHTEPCALVLTEAREAGIPIVATRVGGTPEALSGGLAGLLVEPHDPHRLASAIEAVLRDSVVRKRLLTAGSEGLEEMSVVRMNAETLEVYRAACGSCKGRRARGA